MSDFGSGPFLSRNLDFEVTNTGDIRTSSGIRELEKDIALQSIIQLQSFEGTRQTPRTKVLITSKVNEILTDDPRIDTVRNIDVTFVSTDNSAEIVASVIADNTDQELVFEV